MNFIAPWHQDGPASPSDFAVCVGYPHRCSITPAAHPSAPLKRQAIAPKRSIRPFCDSVGNLLSEKQIGRLQTLLILGNWHWYMFGHLIHQGLTQSLLRMTFWLRSLGLMISCSGNLFEGGEGLRESATSLGLWHTIDFSQIVFELRGISLQPACAAVAFLRRNPSFMCCGIAAALA
ncbi:hypothetical protein CRG98_031433 [Punica granatum]|uniref:Uncharacterized protein n=1 Tax=Punica granatum TaxID=22663 RepID=A0A2I0IVX8_PUNGR|nr:hypothetical protein CRG98_031433 [Punica granatum]